MIDTIIFKRIDELKKYERNSRLHSQKQIEQIAASISEFGFTVPILIDDKNTVLAGHARLEAARLLDINKVPTIIATGWTEAQKRAYVIADNKLAENSEWDLDILKQELDDLKNFEIDLDFLDIDSQIYSDKEKEVDENSKKTTENFKPVEYFDLEHKCPRCGFEFDDV